MEACFGMVDVGLLITTGACYLLKGGGAAGASMAGHQQPGREVVAGRKGKSLWEEARTF